MKINALQVCNRVSLTHTPTETHTDSSPVLLFLFPSYPQDDQEWPQVGDSLSLNPSTDYQCLHLHTPHKDEYEIDMQTIHSNTTNNTQQSIYYLAGFIINL